MKKILILVTVLFCAHLSLYAQAPQGINYQGVARDPQGHAYSLVNISVQITFLQSSATVYQEHQTVTTDTFGLYSIVIGSPAAVITQGNFTSIPWSGGNLMVQVDIDPAGGTAYTTVSTMSLQSVPYALYAQSSGSSSNGTVTNLNIGPGLTSTPTNTITTTGTIDLPTFSGVAGQWGSPSSVPTFSVDSYGRITGVSTQAVNAGQVVVAGVGMNSTVASNTVTLDALNTTPLWNADKLQNTAISATTPLTNDVLQYNGSAWAPAPFGGLPAGSNGQMLFNNGGTWAPTNTSNLIFTGTNLGLGTSTPGANLDVVSATSTPAIRAAAGSGPAIVSNGPLQMNGTLMDAGNTPGASGDVLSSQGPGLAPKWIPASSLGGTLPPPQLGSILFGNTATTWTPTIPANISSDGNSITVVNTTTVGTAGTFITNNAGASNAPALLAQTNSSTGYAIRADNSNGAAILANSGGPYAIAGNIGSGNGSAVAGWLRSGTASGYGIYGLVDSTSSGSAGYFENQGSANTQPTLQVVNDPASGGKSAIFSGGSGVKMDRVQITNGATAGSVLTAMDALGNASWQSPASGGVTSITVTSPLVNTGTGTAPALAIQPGNGSTDGYISVADWNTFNSKLSTVSVNPPFIGNGTGGAPLQLGLNNGNIFVGNPSNIAAAVLMSGDASISNTGVATVKGLQGISVSSAAPAANQVLQYNGAQWAATSLSAAAISGVWNTNGNTALATDFLGTNNTQPLTIATSNSVTLQPILFKTGGLTAGNEKMRIDINGNVGIGTSMPASPLHVFGTNAEVRVENTGGAFKTGLTIKTGIPQEWFIGQDNGPSQIFRIKDVTAGVVRMEIGPSGNVGINKTGPVAQLDVASTSTVTTIAAANTGSAGSAGDFLVNNGANSSMALNVTTTGTGNAGYFSIGNSSNSNAVIYSTTNGNGSAGVFSVTNANGTGVALDVANQGLSQTGSFITNNSLNANYALNVATNGTGNAGNFQINNGSSNATVVYAATTGGGIAVSANSNVGSAVNATSGAGTAVMARNTGNNATIDVANTGSGPAFSAISGGGNNSDVVKSTSGGSGNAIVGMNTGTTGGAGFFSNTGAGNTFPTLQVNTSGAGFSGNFSGGQGLRTDGFTVGTRIVTASITVSPNDCFILINGGAGTLTMPAAAPSNAGKTLIVKCLIAGGWAFNAGFTYIPTTSNTGVNTFPAGGTNTLRLISDGTSWQAW